MIEKVVTPSGEKRGRLQYKENEERIAREVLLVEAKGSPTQPDRHSGHIGRVRPYLSAVPPFFLAIFMRAATPMKKMTAVMMPKTTGRVNMSENCDMVGAREGAARIERKSRG